MTLCFLAPLLAAALLATAAPPADAADDALFRELGGVPGLQAISSDFVAGVKAHPQLAPFFKDTKAAHLAKQLADQWCVLTGGPCTYDGETMQKSHAELGIARADFNASVEVLQAAMRARGVPFGVQNRFLAILAPMHRDIVTK